MHGAFRKSPSFDPKCEPCFTHLKLPNFYLSVLHDLLNEVAAGGKAGGRGGVCFPSL